MRHKICLFALELLQHGPFTGKWSRKGIHALNLVFFNPFSVISKTSRFKSVYRYMYTLTHTFPIYYPTNSEMINFKPIVTSNFPQDKLRFSKHVVIKNQQLCEQYFLFEEEILLIEKIKCSF